MRTLPFDLDETMSSVLLHLWYWRTVDRDERLGADEMDAWREAAAWWVEHSYAPPGWPDPTRALAVLEPKARNP